MGIGDRSGVGGGVGGFFIVVWDGLGEGGGQSWSYRAASCILNDSPLASNQRREVGRVVSGSEGLAGWRGGVLSFSFRS